MISFITVDVKITSFPKRKISEWIKNICVKYDKKVGDICYIFCSESKILEINREYLKHDYYTDIITFDYCKKNIISGDIFICPEIVKENADSFKEIYINELYRVIIHGILHLCGIDDKEYEARAIMEKNENEALELLKKYL